MVSKEIIQTITYFGLTPNQAKVYLAIGSKNFFTINEIRIKSKVPRQDSYRIISRLQELGLVEKTISRPVRFKAIPIQEGIHFLLKQRKKETKKMEQRAEKIIDNYRPEINNNKVWEYEPHFVLIPKKMASLKKRWEEIDNAQKSIDFITSWKRFPSTIHTFGENGIQALKRGVKMRVVLEKPKLMNQVLELVENLKEFPNYELRYILKNPKAIIGIFDKERAIIKTSASVGLAEKPSLWTNNPCFLAILSDYFEIMWITAMEKIPEKLVDITT